MFVQGDIHGSILDEQKVRFISRIFALTQKALYGSAHNKQGRKVLRPCHLFSACEIAAGQCDRR